MAKSLKKEINISSFFHKDFRILDLFF